MTAWITKHVGHTMDTHYYLGFSSLCGDENIANPIPTSYSIRITEKSSYCNVCKSLLKSEKIHQTIKKRKAELESAQNEAAKYRVSLQTMLLNRLTSDDTRAVKISELKELFSKDYPHVHIEDIILPLLLASSKKVRITEDIITLHSMEATHVT